MRMTVRRLLELLKGVNKDLPVYVNVEGPVSGRIRVGGAWEMEPQNAIVCVAVELKKRKVRLPQRLVIC